MGFKPHWEHSLDGKIWSLCDGVPTKTFNIYPNKCAIRCNLPPEDFEKYVHRLVLHPDDCICRMQKPLEGSDARLQENE